MQGYRICIEIDGAHAAARIPNEPMHVHTEEGNVPGAFMHAPQRAFAADTLMQMSDGGNEDDDHEVLPNG